MGQREKIRARKMKAKIQDRKAARRPAVVAAAAKFNASNANNPKGGNAGGGNAGGGSKRSVSYRGCGDVLVVGDGDFSFGKGLVKHMGSGKGVIVTSYDSHSQVLQKYKGAQANIADISKAGGRVMHNVDATNLKRHLAKEKFDRIVFNFPHSGEQRVHVNRTLLFNFFESAQQCLSESGQVHVTLKMRPPYSEWGVEDQARDAGLRLVEVLHFDQKTFPGYRHQTTEKDAKTFVAASEHEARLCKTFCFVPRSGRANSQGLQSKDKDLLTNFEEGVSDESDGDEGRSGEDDIDDDDDDEMDEEQPVVKPVKDKQGKDTSVIGAKQAIHVNAEEQGRTKRQKSGGPGDQQDVGASFWTADMLRELQSEIRGKSAGVPEWGKAADKYAKAKSDDEIPDGDVSLIDAVLDEDETQFLESQGIDSLLGELGTHMVKGTVPKIGAPASSRATGPASSNLKGGKTPLMVANGKSGRPQSPTGAALKRRKGSSSKIRSAAWLLRRSLFYRQSCRGLQALAVAKSFAS